MNKKRLFVFFAALTAVCLFSAAASCNMCGFSIGTPADEIKTEDTKQDEDLVSDQDFEQEVDENESEEALQQDDEEDLIEEAVDEEDAEEAEEDSGDGAEEEAEGIVEFEEEEEEPEPEPEPEEEPIGESLRGIAANPANSGQVVEDRTVFIASESSGAPSIFVGDTATAMLVKGFLSFYISEISGGHVLNAWLTLRGSRVGNPPGLMGIFSVNFTNYGNSLDGSDYGSSSSAIFSSALSNTDFSFSNEDLAQAVQRALDEGRQYFQVKLSTQNANGNGASDGFVFLLSNVGLEVSYN